MKKTFKFLLVSFISLSGEIKAQVLEDLKAPAMPAATIIGTQINEINKPKSLRALESAVMNNYFDPTGNALFPNNYAIEINPFMLSKRTNFDYLRYLDDSINQNLWRNLSFSVASTNSFKISDSVTSNALGFGGRTIILNGKVDQELEKSYKNKLANYKKLNDGQSQIITMIGIYKGLYKTFILDSLEAFLIESIPEQKANITAMFNVIPETTTKNEIREVIEDMFQPIVENALNEFKMVLDKVKSERYGWRWEIDGALSLCFPTNDFNNSVSPKYGLWSNISYRPPKKSTSNKMLRVPGDFEFIGLFRWINNNDDFISKYIQVDSLQINSGNIIDIGARAVYDLKKFSAEFEFIYRLNQNIEYVTVNENEYSRTTNENTFKYVFNLNYNISNDIIFSYNIGKNYDIPMNKSGDLISGFTLSFGFGSVKKDDLINVAIKNIMNTN